MIRRATLPLAAAVLGTTLLTSGCVEQPAARVETIPQVSKETTGSLTPIERGRIRREALDSVRELVKAWDAGDKDTMKAKLPASVYKRFEDRWKEYGDGTKVQGVRDVRYLDVTEMNKAGTQATVAYKFHDGSKLVNASGKTVGDLPAIKNVECSITLERKEGTDEWKIIRMFMKDEAYR